MSEENNRHREAPEAPRGSKELEEAMREAVEAVEKNDRKAAPPEAEGKKAPAAAEAVTEAILKAKQELEQVLEQTQKEAEHLRDKWLRAAADLENYRKRAARERDEVVRFGNEKLLKDLLPVADDLDRAIAAVEGDASAPSSPLLDGVKLVRKKLALQLEKAGVTTFGASGEAFDPSRHEAVQQVYSELPAGKIASELQRGYLLNDRLLRPAMVVVSLGPEPTGDGGGAQSSSAPGES